MTDSEQVTAELRARLDDVLANGLAQEPKAHAGQVAGVLGVLSEAFGYHGFSITLVGGSAIEVHAPGIYMSGELIAFEDDLDLVWLHEELARERAGDAFEALRDLARSGTSVTHERLLAVVDDLHEREGPLERPRQDGHDGAN